MSQPPAQQQASGQQPPTPAQTPPQTLPKQQQPQTSSPSIQSQPATSSQQAAGACASGTSSVPPTSPAPIYHFKVLVPAAAAGRIIGKGGNAIVQLQKDAGARIKLSKASEFYPGTTERVCLISGPIEGILKIIESIVKSLTPDHLSRPNMSSSPTTNNQNHNSSSNNNNNNASHHGISAYGQLLPAASSSTITTSSAAGPLVGAALAAPSSANHFSRPTSSLSPSNCQLNGVASGAIKNSNINQNNSISNSSSLTPVARPLSPAPSVTSDMNSAQIIETIKLVLRVSGYGEDAVTEISSGMSTLASYGVLGVGLGLL